MGKKDKWISVKDKLPDNQKRVLIISDNGFKDIDTYHNGFPFDNNEIDERYTKVTHWMSLPESPT